MKQQIIANNAPQAIGPYNQAISTGNILFMSGQIPFTKDGVLAGDDIKIQTKQCLNNIQAILDEAGLNKENVVKITVFLKDMNDFVLMNEVYSDFFKDTVFPARSTVEVSRLPKDVKVEIEAIAVIG